MISQRVAVIAADRLSSLTLLCTRFDSGWWHSLPTVFIFIYFIISYYTFSWLFVFIVLFSGSGQLLELLQNNILKHLFTETRLHIFEIYSICFSLPNIFQMIILLARQIENIY